MLAVTELLLVHPDIRATVAVGLYSIAVGIFAPMQFLFSRRVPTVPVEILPLARPSRAGLVVTGLAAAAAIVLAAVGGIRLG